MSNLTDVFALPSTVRPDLDDESADGIETERLAIVHPAPDVVEANYRLLIERTAEAERAAVARRHAATARQVAQSFGEYARGLRKRADSVGSEVDHAVAVFLAETCELQVAEHVRLQARYTAEADRAGSI